MLKYQDKMFKSEDSGPITGQEEVNKKTVTKLDELALRIVDGQVDVRQIEIRNNRGSYHLLDENPERTMEVTYVE